MNAGDSPTLHILNKPPGHERFLACLDAIAPGDIVLLVENAVTALADVSVALPDGTLALSADCEARGLGRSEAENTGRVDYQGMVRLTDRFVRIISW